MSSKHGPKAARLTRSASQKSRDATKLASRAVLAELATFKPSLPEEYRILLGLGHALAVASTASALFATGREIGLALTEEGAKVGILWSKGCSTRKNECWPGEETDKALLIACHILGVWNDPSASDL